MNTRSIEEETIFNHLCIANGIDRISLTKEESKCEKLEFFFSGFPRIISLSAFPYLSELVIINQSINTIENLDVCTNLVCLWICECELTSIEGLDQCGQIRNLYLYDNKITKIKNLYSLRLLEILWLNNNKIEIIEGLDELIILRELNLTGNLIKRIGKSLQNNISIEKLYISGNQLEYVYDLLNLCKLPKLKYLIVNGPDDLPNPVFYHTNFYLFMMFHFPNLKRLDTFDVNSSYLKDLVLNIINKKKLFYFMKIESLDRDSSFMKLQLKMNFNDACKYPKLRIFNLTKLINLMEMDVTCTNTVIVDSIENLSIPEKKKFTDEIIEINSRIKSVEMCIEALEMERNFYLQKVELERTELRSLFQLEFSSCGNFKFEISSEKLWVNLCNELVNSRFCNSEFNIADFHQIKTHRVIKIKNFQVESNYMKTIQNIIELNKVNGQFGLQDYKIQDYLFLVIDDNDNRSLISILNSLYSYCPGELIKLTNSLYTGDVMKNRNSKYFDKLYYGRVIMVKACVFPMTKDDLEIIMENISPEISFYDTVKIPSKVCSNNNLCSCSDYRYDWHFKTNKLFIPEYIVDFEYMINNYDNKSKFYYTFHGLKNDPVNKSQYTYELDNDLDDIKYNLEYDMIKKNALSLIVKMTSDSLKCISVLNLTNSNLKSIPEISSLINLTELIMPFNNLLNLKDIVNQKLKILDVNYNQIQTLDDMNELQALNYFYIQNNFLMKTREEISILCNKVPNLINLNVKFNLFRKSETVRLRLIGRLKFLKILNDKEVNSAELKLALETVLQSRMSESQITDCGRTDTIKPRSLIIDCVANILLTYSDNKITCQINESSKFLRITALSLNSQYISKISNIEKLENLKYLSLSNNCISKIEGLESCTHLEELILDNNTISKIEGLSKQQRLKKLSLNENYINSVIYMKNLNNTQILSIHTNKIISFAGLENCDSLVELYAANNYVTDSTEISILKTLGNLIILDLQNNPISQCNKNYRLNMIFNLKHLKGLDGICVDNLEIYHSKDILGGRLNLDFINEKIGNENYADLSELDLSNCCLKSVDLAPVDKLKNLRSLNLENNNLTSFSGLIFMYNLKVLCLNSNSIESIIPKLNNKVGIQPIQKSEVIQKVNLKSLEVLHLGYNNIKNINLLGLNEIPSLKALFLQGNDISSIDGLDYLINLREIVLDQNRIKSISENSFSNNINLHEIHLDDNRIKNLTNIYHIKHLKRLYIGNNKITDLHDLDLFYSFEFMIDISLNGNPVSRRQQHRQYLIHMIPSLLMIDGIEITDDERLKIESNVDENTDNNILPGIINQTRTQKSNSTFYNMNDFNKTDYLKGDNYKKRSNAINSYNFNNKTNSIQLVANSKAVYFYDPIGQIESIPRLNLNKRK